MKHSPNKQTFNSNLSKYTASNRKVAKPWFDSDAVAVSLRKSLNAISHFGTKQSTRCGDPV